MTAHEWVQATVMVTVKTYPTPSQDHLETVCVAGVRLDTDEPQWVRLYPIPFRTESFDYPFAKYQVIELRMRSRGSKDTRPESFAPDLHSFRLGPVIRPRGNWQERKMLLEPLIGATTTCDLIALNRATSMADGAASLGLIKPIDPVIHSIEEGPSWTAKQQLKVDRAAQPTLFSDGPQIKHPLQPPGYMIKVRYKCQNANCRGHQQTILDWEVGSAAFNWRRRYPAKEIRNRLLAQWRKLMGSDRDVHFYVGNQHQYRNSFSILGIWSPKL